MSVIVQVIITQNYLSRLRYGNIDKYILKIIRFSDYKLVYAVEIKAFRKVLK